MEGPEARQNRHVYDAKVTTTMSSMAVSGRSIGIYKGTWKLSKRRGSERKTCVRAGTNPTATEDEKRPAEVDVAKKSAFARAASVVAAAGTLECAYLSVLSWKNAIAGVACSAGGSCASVLSSEYAKLLGLPLPVYGAVGYAAIAVMAWKWASEIQEESMWREFTFNASWMFAGGSLWLMILLHGIMKQDCDWCHVSALLSFTVAGLVTASIPATIRMKCARRAATFAAASALGLGVMQLGPGLLKEKTQAQAFDLPYSEAVVHEESSERAQILASRLRDAGAKMYGAFWCGHCYEQKESFGKQAVEVLPYVECYPDGFRRGFGNAENESGKKDTPPAKACVDAQIDGFPTWVVGSERLEGEQTFDQLEKALDKAEKRSPQ